MFRAALLLCWLALAAGQALAAPSTRINVHVDLHIPQGRLTIQFPHGTPIELTSPTSDGTYRNYQYDIHWPINGRLQGNDFQLFAKVTSGPSRAFYLRLRPNETPVDIYVFDRHFAQCQWQNLVLPAAPDDVFEQLATAEAMLTIANPEEQCSVDNLQNWTGVWIDRINRLWRMNQFVRLNPNVVTAIRAAYARPHYSLFNIFGAPTPLPAGFQPLLNLDQALSAKFN